MIDSPAEAKTELATEAAEEQAGTCDGWIGRVIDDRYQIESKLGEGGMGAVFVARHLRLQKPVALKVIRAELAGNGEVAVRFAREAMATAQFEHPHVASAIDYGSLPEGGAYFVMQLVRGRSLRARLAAGPVAWRDACRLMAQVADALSAACASGIVHRDLKPENILVEQRDDGSELVKVLDFGIAHITPSDAAAPEGAAPRRALTRVGAVMGTPGYMAPEQAVGDRVDHRTDLYALGVMLWECITGRDLWDEPDITTLITRQVSEDAPPLSQVASDPAIPTELCECVARLLSRRPDDRPAHAAEVRDLLRRLAERDPVGPSPSSTLAQRPVPWHAWRRRLGPALESARRQGQQLLRAWRAQPPKRRRQQVVGVAAAPLVVALLLALTADEAPHRVQPAAAAPKGQGTGRSVMEEVVQTVEASLTPGIPVEIADEIEAVLEGERRRDRRDAAVVVLAFEPREAVAPYVVTLAELETARGCRDRKRAIEAIVALGDDAAVPALERWQAMPKNGCGLLNLQDCYACIRRPLAQAIESLRE